MAKHMQNVRDLLRQFALKHDVAPDQVIDTWSQNKRRKISLDLSTKLYEERLNWWTEPTLPQGHTLRIDVFGQTSYVIITITDIVLLTQPEVARKQRDYVLKKRSKMQSVLREVQQRPMSTASEPTAEQVRVSLNKVLKNLARISGTKIGVIMVLWNSLVESRRMQLTSLIPREVKLSRETCTKLGLEFPTWKFSGFYFTLSTTMLRNGQKKRTPRMIPVGHIENT